MKTPREVLLQKHKAMESRLDSIRSEVVSARCSREREHDSWGEPLLSAAKELWNNLFLPSRRIWAGLAMLWLVVIALNVVTPDESSSHYAATVLPKNTPERQLALQERQRLLAELLNGTVHTEAKAQPYVPRPSSRALPPIRFV